MESILMQLSFVLAFLSGGFDGGICNIYPDMSENPYGYEVFLPEDQQIIADQCYEAARRRHVADAKSYGWRFAMSFEASLVFHAEVSQDYFCWDNPFGALTNHAMVAGQWAAARLWYREFALRELFDERCEGCGDNHGLVNEAGMRDAYRILLVERFDRDANLAARYIAEQHLAVFTSAYGPCGASPEKYFFDQHNLRESIRWFTKAGFSARHIKKEINNALPQLKRNGAAPEVFHMVEAELARL